MKLKVGNCLYFTDKKMHLYELCLSRPPVNNITLYVKQCTEFTIKLPCTRFIEVFVIMFSFKVI